MATTTQTDQWLAEHGLGQYIDVFRANDIDMRALSYLTEDDLRELGVSLGHPSNSAKSDRSTKKHAGSNEVRE